MHRDDLRITQVEMKVAHNFFSSNGYLDKLPPFPLRLVGHSAPSAVISVEGTERRPHQTRGES